MLFLIDTLILTKPPRFALPKFEEYIFLPYRQYTRGNFLGRFHPYLVLLFGHAMATLVFSNIEFILIQFNTQREFR